MDKEITVEDVLKQLLGDKYESAKLLFKGQAVIDVLKLLESQKKLNEQQKRELQGILDNNTDSNCMSLSALKRKKNFINKVLTRLFYFKNFTDVIKAKVTLQEFEDFKKYNIPDMVGLVVDKEGYSLLSADAIKLIEEFRQQN